MVAPHINFPRLPAMRNRQTGQEMLLNKSFSNCRSQLKEKAKTAENTDEQALSALVAAKEEQILE
jgi:hypothetical protein